MNARLLCSLCIIYIVADQVVAYEPESRWGQAVVSIKNALFVHGGKTDPFNSYSYTSAPTSNDILYLPLSTSFDVSSPPWQLLSGSPSASQGPSLSWHTLSAFNTSHTLLFGGQPGPNSPTVLVGVADSAHLLNVYNRLEPAWTFEPESWANEPIRRVRHSTSTSLSGSVFVIGGEKADGSGIAFSEHYIFNPNGPSFTLLPAVNGPPDITGHASVMLPDHRLLVFGGFSPTSQTLLPFSSVWALDTTQSTPSWSSISINNTSLPSPRRAFASTILSEGKVLIHGGSDAILQNDLADGWILDTSQDPMVWTAVDALSQLGARRDHFAVSFGNQVLFGFGYGNGKAAPASLQIFDAVRDDFTPGFTPLPHSSTPPQTLPNPSQTTQRPTPTGSSSRSSTGIHPTNTASTKPGDPSERGDGSPHDSGTAKSDKTTAVAVGTTLGVFALLVMALAGAYYVRYRRRNVDASRFTAIQGSDNDDDARSLFAGRVTTGYPQDRQSFRTLGALGLTGGIANAVAAVTGSRGARHAPERRDMLADEDTRDFGTWYDARRRDGTGGSSWSLRSIISPRRKSREPSITDNAASWIEKIDPFSDAATPTRDEEYGYVGASWPQGRRQMSYASVRSYHDPFADPIEEEDAVTFEHYADEDVSDASMQPYLHPLPQQLPILRTILPASQGGHALSPLTERASQTTLSLRDAPNSVSSHTTSHNSPFDTASSNVTSRTSLDPPKSPVLFTSSIIGATPTNMPMKRSDSWWSRFARTSFLDRRPSNTSSRGMPEIRDPNPPPRLISIEESVHSTSPDRQSTKSLQNLSSGLSRNVSRLHGSHNKSLSSMRTADTETIERIAGTMDVVQLVRSGSRRTVSTGTTPSMSIDTHAPLGSWIHDDYGAGGHEDPDMANIASPIEMSDAEAFYRQSDLDHLFTVTQAQLISPPIASSPASPTKPSIAPPSNSGAVAARIQELERRQSHDQDNPPPLNTWRHEERSSKKRAQSSVNYGMIPRASLYVANPDHRTSSGDS
ncbi:hypothetical protein DXG03_001693 [Asterophora parasitica]|uniref:Galactose oxidase n=1 Tax=Asterophora parasitica TaxID=117018 RepID=A0A9P7GCS4_9AGAR|nr:hypothetical protein DXG03_001693 [Asterophora parasitica]